MKSIIDYSLEELNELTGKIVACSIRYHEIELIGTLISIEEAANLTHLPTTIIIDINGLKKTIYIQDVINLRIID